MKEAVLDVESFKEDFPNISFQKEEREWHHILTPQINISQKMVWEFYASYRAQMDHQIKRENTEESPSIATLLVRGNKCWLPPQHFTFFGGQMF